MLEAALSAVEYGRLYMWYLQSDKRHSLKKEKGNYDVICQISPHERSDGGFK